MAELGLRVVAPLRGSRESYVGMRGARVARLQACADVLFDSPFGGPNFLDLIESESFEILAHHAADVYDYNKWSFDPLRALQRNTMNAAEVFARAVTRGCRAVVITGTVFEANAGGDPDGLAANPYGLSKSLTTDTLRHFAAWAGLRFGRFIVANPFGPLEERRFCWYLFKTWLSGGVPIVQTPSYVRDNVPVSMMAAAYAAYVQAMIGEPPPQPDCRPSGYVMSQGAFAQLMAAEVSKRLGMTLTVSIANQTEFSEPYIRVNDQRCFIDSEIAQFWDGYVQYYCDFHRSGDLN